MRRKRFGPSDLGGLPECADRLSIAHSELRVPQDQEQGQRMHGAIVVAEGETLRNPQAVLGVGFGLLVGRARQRSFPGAPPVPDRAIRHIARGEVLRDEFRLSLGNVRVVALKRGGDQAVAPTPARQQQGAVGDVLDQRVAEPVAAALQH